MLHKYKKYNHHTLIHYFNVCIINKKYKNILQQIQQETNKSSQIFYYLFFWQKKKKNIKSEMCIL